LHLRASLQVLPAPHRIEARDTTIGRINAERRALGAEVGDDHRVRIDAAVGEREANGLAKVRIAVSDKVG
jgi:hypothetical protein